MRALAQTLISAEYQRSDPADSEGLAAFRVCEKLRGSLSPLVGTHGFKMFLLRALALARTEAAWLDRVEVDAGGTLLLPADVQSDPGMPEVVTGGHALVAQVLELLMTFIGHALTQRLVLQIWHAALPDPSNLGRET